MTASTFAAKAAASSATSSSTPIRALSAPEARFVARDNQAGFDAGGDVRLEGEQPSRLALVDGRDRPWPSSRVIAPRRRVQVDKIDDRSDAWQVEHVLSHGRRKDERSLDALAPHDVLDPHVQRAAVEIRQRQRFAGEQGPGTAYPL